MDRDKLKGKLERINAMICQVEALDNFLEAIDCVAPQRFQITYMDEKVFPEIIISFGGNQLVSFLASINNERDRLLREIKKDCEELTE